MKNQSIVVIIGLALLVIGAITYRLNSTLPADNSMGMNMHNQDSVPPGMHRMPDGSLMKNGGATDADDGMGMMGGMDHSMMMVTSEKEFITEMIPHHQEAVDTAKEVLARGATTPEIKALVEGIITSQEKEIADMKAWYEAWYGTPFKPSGNYQPMMRDLSKLSGAELDTVFLEDMIMHHMGAIMMARSVQGKIEHKEVEDLSKAIIETQSEEIQLMRQLLAQLN